MQGRSDSGADALTAPNPLATTSTNNEWDEVGMERSEQLAGKVAIVTGAGQGIGEAIALGYAAAGAKVVITGRTKSKLDDVVAKIEAAGGTALATRRLRATRIMRSSRSIARSPNGAGSMRW
jgi:hypothetical protein